MDFRYPPEAEAFRTEFRAWLDANLPDELRGRRARRIARDRAATALERLRAWNRTLADARYAAIAWPEEWGGRGAGVMEQVVYAEEMHRAARAGHAQPARPVEHRARDHRARHRRAEAHAAPPHAPRRRHLVPGLLRAERRLRPRVAAHVGGARRRLLDRQRPEDVEHARPHRELVRAARAHRSRACRSTRASRACSST